VARKALAALSAVLLAGCSLAPDYQRPALATPPAFKEGPWQAAGANVAPPGKWWQAFGDPALDALEERIEAGNYTLAAAAARYDQARGLAQQARSSLFPTISAGASIAHDRTSASAPGRSVSLDYTDKVVGASLAYEIDLFGRVRNQAAASGAAADAAGFDRDAVRLGLQSQLASVYFDLRGLDARIVLLRQTIAAFQRAYDLTDTRHGGGVSSGIDVSRAQAQVSSARAELSTVTIARARDEHALAVLVGEAPASFALPVSDVTVRPPAITAGVPSTLLERRPDIAAAERRVFAANAGIGVARAAWFPSVTLGGSGGFESTGASWLSASSGFWALGPLQAALTLVDGGRRAAGVRIARARHDEAAATYRETVLTAFREVEDDLATGRMLVAGEADQAEAARAAERTRDLALTRYHDGAADYLEVVIAQTAALDAERALLELRARQLQNASDTYRALGGGV
jgi:outer membrane protein, multidrug efflux system